MATYTLQFFDQTKCTDGDCGYFDDLEIAIREAIALMKDEYKDYDYCDIFDIDIEEDEDMDYIKARIIRNKGKFRVEKF